MTTKTPRQFFRPLAIGAPEPFRELPLRLERMIHFVPPHLEKVRAKVGDLAKNAETRVRRDLALQLLAGPQRIEAGWWDEADQRRDYYLIETRSGQRAWAYRPLGENGPLMLQGWFA